MDTGFGGTRKGTGFVGRSRGHLTDLEVFVRSNDSTVAGIWKPVTGFVEVAENSQWGSGHRKTFREGGTGSGEPEETKPGKRFVESQSASGTCRALRFRRT